MFFTKVEQLEVPGLDREILAKGIIRILDEVNRPMNAREITAQLQDQGWVKVTRRDVNGVLYSERYSHNFERDANFRWRLRPGAVMITEGSGGSLEHIDPEQQTGKNPTVLGPVKSGSDRIIDEPRLNSVRWLRMQLWRLKAGMPVDTSLLPTLTVGMDDLREKLNNLLDGQNSGRWMAVAGEFGGGKSHFLSLARYLACAKGWAVCSLVANTADGSLAQPQRHLQFLLDTVVSPQGSAVGIVELFMEWWNGSLRPQILQWARANAVILPLAYDLVLLERELLEFDTVSEFLGAKILGARTGNPMYRRAVCHHLAQVIGLLKATGHRGLVLLFDEVESVFRLATSRSWTAALRSLGTYCCDPLLTDLALVFVATPQARQEIQVELPRILQEVESQVSTPEEEKAALRRFVEELKKFGWSECPKLDGDQRIALGQCIVDLHARANGRGAPMYPTPRMLAWLSRRDVTIRHAVRTLLAWLDSYA